MKTDERGGAAADENLEERLSRRFAVELQQAERDYPVLGRLRADSRARRHAGRIWPRLAMPVAAVAVLAVVGLGAGLLYNGTTPAGPGVVRGSDGIPTWIDGERVYGVADQSEWQKLNGSFLLSAVPYITEVPAEPYCNGDAGNLASAGASNPLEGDPSVWASSTPEVCLRFALDAPPAHSVGSGITFEPSMPVVTKQSSTPLLDPWVGIGIVMRVHTHDAVAAGCSTVAAAFQAACDAEVVVEAVAWPVVPAEIAGQHGGRVYRFSDQGSFPTSGSFLLGGPFTKPSVVPPCPAPIGWSQAEQQLIPYCFTQSIDSVAVAPMSNIDEPNDEIVVARVHINDPLAAQCSAEVRADCQAAIVVEAVVWRSDDLITASPSAGASASLSTDNPAPTDTSGPATPIPTVLVPQPPTPEPTTAPVPQSPTTAPTASPGHT